MIDTLKSLTQATQFYDWDQKIVYKNRAQGRQRKTKTFSFTPQKQGM